MLGIQLSLVEEQLGGDGGAGDSEGLDELVQNLRQLIELTEGG